MWVDGHGSAGKFVSSLPKFAPLPVSSPTSAPRGRRPGVAAHLQASAANTRCTEQRLLNGMNGGPGAISLRSASMPGCHDPQRNRLLAALSPRERERIYPQLQLVEMPLGGVLYESDDVLRHAYFPTDSIVSVLYVLADGASTELLAVGNEGLIGIALFMGGETTPSRAIVQSAGHAYRLVGQLLKDEFHRDGPMRPLLLRYTQALITQMAQTAVCNRHHTVDQQLCRWLLLSLDRLSSNELIVTQERIANMLGVRREGVTEAACRLDKLGVIRNARGRISILNRSKLENLCCECYAVVKKEADRLLPPALPR